MGKRTLPTIVNRFDAGEHISTAEMQQFYGVMSELNTTMIALGMSWRARFGYHSTCQSLQTYLHHRNTEVIVPTQEDYTKRESLFQNFTLGIATDGEIEEINEILESNVSTLEALGDEEGLGTYFSGLLEQAQLTAGISHTR